MSHRITQVERDGEGFTVDAATLACVLGRPEADLRARFAAGEITTRFETGEGADAGRFRLTFRDGARRLRLTVDAEGRVLSQSLITTGAGDAPQDGEEP